LPLCPGGLGRCLGSPMARSPFGVGDQLFSRIPVRADLWADLCRGGTGLGLRSAEQVALKGDQRWLLRRRGHGSAGRGA